MKVNKEVDFEKMSHMDIVYYILEKDKKMYKTVDLLKKLCNLLEYDESMFESLIGDFYTSLNIDKRFILIDGKWDLQKNHIVNVVVEDEMDEYDEEDDDEDELDEETVEDEAVLEETDALEDIDDDLDDDMDDLSIVDEDELDEENEENI